MATLLNCFPSARFSDEKHDDIVTLYSAKLTKFASATVSRACDRLMYGKRFPDLGDIMAECEEIEARRPIDNALPNPGRPESFIAKCKRLGVDTWLPGIGVGMWGQICPTIDEPCMPDAAFVEELIAMREGRWKSPAQRRAEAYAAEQERRAAA